MGYSESLFLAFAAATLLAAHRKAWLTAGVLAMLAGLTRPAAAAVAAALAVAVVLHAVRTLARCRPRTVALTLTAAALFGCWYGAYMLTAWHYTI
ncbi:hypothetical protein [Streptomyces sp. NRRL S-87]|uniref:hypothetical protein n=1 Tax=Streptomyces sp. NRRL S-87 TaxID=1463920 RepID=UPI0004C04626|nr:hypothetical protein [Streptomyces sp. NRRL S-87]